MTGKPSSEEQCEEYDVIETGGSIGEEQVQGDPSERPRPTGLPGGGGGPRKLSLARRKELERIAAADRARRRESEADVDGFDYRGRGRADREG